MNLENKKTVLDDDASIYDHSSDKLTDREKFKTMNRKQKLQQFKDYYLLKIIVAIVSVGVVVSLLVSIFKEKPEPIIHIAVSDGAMTGSMIDRVIEEFGNKMNIDPAHQEVVVDSSFSFNSNFYNSLEAYGVYHAVGELSVSVVPMSVFEALAQVGYFKNMSGVISSELFDELLDYHAMAAITDEDGNIKQDSYGCYGLKLSTTFLYENVDMTEEVVLAVHASCKDDKICEEFIKYLFQK